jgi:Ca2+-binding RTX toxin-like protein
MLFSVFVGAGAEMGSGAADDDATDGAALLDALLMETGARSRLFNVLIIVLLPVAFATGATGATDATTGATDDDATGAGADTPCGATVLGPFAEVAFAIAAATLFGCSGTQFHLRLSPGTDTLATTCDDCASIGATIVLFSTTAFDTSCATHVHTRISTTRWTFVDWLTAGAGADTVTIDAGAVTLLEA